jgi:aryl-alcohol dehydrogenase-like predicted oxidoreductase
MQLIEIPSSCLLNFQLESWARMARKFRPWDSVSWASLPFTESRNRMRRASQFLDRAYELGEKFWDSADAYGDSEDLLGKWFKRTGKRDEIFLAIKVWYELGSYTGQKLI